MSVSFNQGGCGAASSHGCPTDPGAPTQLGKPMSVDAGASAGHALSIPEPNDVSHRASTVGYAGVLSDASADCCRRSLTLPGSKLRVPRMIAATPATCGAAYDVPDAVE